MNIRIIVSIVLLFSLTAFGQDLRQIPLAQKDSMEGVVLKYGYEATGSYGTISLVLKKDGKYVYRNSSFQIEKVSEGEWHRSKNFIKLNSSLQKNNVPIKISYGVEGEYVDSLKIAVVKNIKNEPLTDAFVLVNNDSIKCLPLIGQCEGSFKKIERIKILFENGMCSKWVNVKRGSNKLLITVQSSIPIRNFVVMHDRKFEVVGGLLKFNE